MTAAVKPTLAEKSMAPSPSLHLFALSAGGVVATALSLVAELGIADLLAAGTLTSDELAQATGTHPRSLYRLLRLLSSVGVFTEIEEERFSLTPLGQCLRSGVPGSMRSWVRAVSLPAWMRALGVAMHSIRSGEPSFKIGNGAEFFDYFAANPVEEGIFDEAMDDVGRIVSESVVRAYDFTGIPRLMDVGGGHGTQLAAILRCNPQMTGVLFDVPHLAEAGRRAIFSAGLSGRCEYVGGDFFLLVPAGADAYLLRWIIHDWDHERAITILTHCREAMGRKGRLLLVEMVLPPGDEPHLGKLMDFRMLVGLGGEERTEQEYAELLREAGFRLTRIVPTDSPFSVIEAVPAV